MYKTMICGGLIWMLLMGCLAARPQADLETDTDAVPSGLDEEIVRMQTHQALTQGLVPPPNRREGDRGQDKHSTASKPMNISVSSAVDTSCTKLQYRNPVVDRIRIPAGIRGGVYIPSHEAYVVIHPGRWEVVAPSGHAKAALPSLSVACPAEGGRR